MVSVCHPLPRIYRHQKMSIPRHDWNDDLDDDSENADDGYMDDEVDAVA